jgi:hypothetical protein
VLFLCGCHVACFAVYRWTHLILINVNLVQQDATIQDISEHVHPTLPTITFSRVALFEGCFALNYTRACSHKVLSLSSSVLNVYEINFNVLDSTNSLEVVPVFHSA